MFLELINFRCFSKLEVQIPDSGVILLHGGSGIGKTTILKALNFVLYGKEQKIVKYNEKKCLVRLKYKNTLITRTKTPNHLTIEMDGQKYEDETAQEIIFKKYGKYFNITSYVAQKSIESFASLPVADKMEFFNNLALKDFDVKSLKDKIKDTIKDKKKELSDKTNEIRILNNELSAFELPTKDGTVVQIPSFLDENSLEESIHDHKMKKDKITTELQTLNKNLQSCRKKIKQLEEDKNTQIQLETKINSITDEISSREIELEKMKLDSKEDYTEFLNKLKIFSQYLNLVIQINELNKNIEENKKEVLDKEENNLLIIEDKLKKSVITKDNLEFYNILVICYTKFDSILDLFPNLEKAEDLLNVLSKKSTENTSIFLKIKKEISELEKENLQKETNIKNINKVQKCPKCSTSLLVKNENIEIFSLSSDDKKEIVKTLQNEVEINNKKINDLNKELNAISTSMMKCEKIVDYNLSEKELQTLNFYIRNKNTISSSKNIMDGIKEFQTLLTEEKSIKSKLDNIETNELILNLQKKIDKCNKTLSSLKKECEKELNSEFLNKLNEFELFAELEDIKKWTDFSQYDESDILDMTTDVFNEVQKKENQRELLIKKLKDIETKIQSLNKEKNKLTDVLSEIDISGLSDLEDKIEDLEEQIKEKEIQKDECFEKDRQLIEYMSYKNEIDRYNSLKEKIEECNQDEKRLVKSLSVSENFLKIVGNAEALSVSNTLNNINNIINYYLTHFFPNGDFEMKLTPYKETAKGDKKSGLDIEIIYNSEKIGIDNLSGGEFDRCLLVLFLAFNNITNSDIILLDECLSSLNAELVEDIVDVLKSSLKDKLVLLTLHQANTGIFDYIIDVEKLRG